ncbi:MAG: flagellum-specific ATP synthase FliI, partial [Dehalococcoidia bacterium]
MPPEVPSGVPPEMLTAPAEDALALDFQRYHAALDAVRPMRVRGRVSNVIGLLVEVEGIQGLIGEMCRIERATEGSVAGEIVGFRGDRALLMPLDDLRGVQAGAPVVSDGALFTVPVGPQLLGRVVDGRGRPIDGRGPVSATFRQPLSGASPHVLTRRPIREPLSTGVRAIDGLLTCGKGQRIGIFAG